MAAFLQEEAVFTPAVKLVEDGEPIDGGSEGPINVQAKHLADRTQYLKQKVDTLLASGASGSQNAAREFFIAQI